MATHKLHVMQFRRKRENKTDYKARLSLIKSRKARFVVRRSLKHVIIQAIKYEAKGDKVLFTVSTEQVKKMGWKHSTSSIPASYLAGLVAGKKAESMKITQGVLDIGLQTSIKGTRIYAALKGLIDGGIDIPASETVFPSEDRITGKHIAQHTKKDSLEKDFTEFKSKILI